MECIGRDIYDNAYIPEHIPEYLISFSNLECRYSYPYIYYYGGGDLRIIGYPLNNVFNENDFLILLTRLVDKYNPRILSVMTPRKLINYPYKISYYESDYYYILNLDSIHINKKLRNIIRRAEREVSINIGRSFSIIHRKLIKRFCKRKRLNKAYIKMFNKIQDYIKYSKTAQVIEAWRGEELIAFTIYENAPRKYGFYLFNFTEDKRKYVPGTSDLLLMKCIDLAMESGKRYINMGLGINEGVRYFKLKWGGRPIIEYNYIFTYLRP